MSTAKTNSGINRRGRRSGQAVKSYSPDQSVKAKALISILGQDFVDKQVELMDCLVAFEKCPDKSPAQIPAELTNLAWRMLRALQDGDDLWLNRLLRVRCGVAFSALAAEGRIAPINPLRTILGYLAKLQMDGIARAVNFDEARQFVVNHDPAADPEDDTTFRTACHDAGVKLLAMKRGRKLGAKLTH